MITTDSIIRVAREQVSTELGGEVAILSLSNGVYYGLDPVGAFIWRQIQEPRSVADLRAAIVDEYNVDEEECQADLLRLLSELQDHGLIQIDDGAIGSTP